MYDKASLALIPSGTKTGKLYSVLPANDDGDFIFERGTTATRVNKDGLIETVSSDVPRLDYPITNGVVGDCPHLLLEPLRTNIIPYSNDFNQHALTGGSITSDDIVSPDGSINADTFVEDTNNSQHKIREDISVTSGTYTMSCFVKGTDRFISLYPQGISTAYAVFDIANENVTVSGGSDYVSSDIQNYGSGWYRCSLTYDVDTGTSYTHIYLSNSSTNPSPTYTGNGSEMSFYGLQLEAGNYATSYIPTIGLAETRLGDVCYNSGTSAEFNDSEGVLFAEVEFLDNANTGYISVSDGTADNRCIIYSTANQIVVATKSGGSGISKSATGTPTNLNKIAVAYSSSGSKFFLNGSNETGTGSFSTTPRVFAANTLDQINFDISDGSNDLYARVKQVIYFNEALSDSELQTLTS